MSQTDGLAPSADWVATNMEAMLRECDALIAAKDEHLRRLKAGVAALESELQKIDSERTRAIVDREKAERVLSAFRTAVKEGTGLRQSRGDVSARLRVVPNEPSPTPSTGDTHEPLSEQGEPGAEVADCPEPKPGPVAAVRITGARAVAVMRIIALEPDRDWTPKQVALRLEGEEKEQDFAAHNRARAPPPYTYGAIPDGVFGSLTDLPPPKGPEAPPLTLDERFEYLLDNPDLYSAAAALPEPSQVGRPAHYPPVVYLIFLCSISLFGSARSTAIHLQRPMWWETVRAAVRVHLGDEAAAALKPIGPSRGHWNHYFRRHLKPVWDDIRDISRELWIKQALDHGMMQPTGARASRICPERHQVLHGDATVAAPPSSHSEHETCDENGVLHKHRVDEDTGITTEGGGKQVYGNKFLSVGVRFARLPHSRVILAIESIRHRSQEEDPEREAEGAAFIRMVRHIPTRAPGLLAATYDAALRGVHRAPLIADGLLVFIPQHAGLPPQSLKRYECSSYAHDVYVAEARVCERRITVDGETHYNPLPVAELEYREGTQACRFYHRMTIPCPVEEHTIRIRVDETADDRQVDPSTQQKRFNRTEHLRQVPPDTPAGRRLKGFRQDSESTPFAIRPELPPQESSRVRSEGGSAHLHRLRLAQQLRQPRQDQPSRRCLTGTQLNRRGAHPPAPDPPAHPRLEQAPDNPKCGPQPTRYTVRGGLALFSCATTTLWGTCINSLTCSIEF
jgi:hypothetical protein